ncbi:MAG TPA: methyltransferase domain-containing protein [Bryobacteraceae bacterium]|nr:methyltransferase domain-containing protein [Bryobacteraceae bacterium]
MRGYRQDLAYIHDAGFTDYARNAAPGLLEILRRNGVKRGRVADLGCGSGRWARELNRAGYEVWGVDQSAAMIQLARRMAPRSEFKTGSLLRIALPACNAVTCIGECVNYTFDQRNSTRSLGQFFRRVFDALGPGGVFVFDFAEPARIPKTPERKWSEGRDWAILVSIQGDRRRHTLIRRIVTFRRTGARYRRAEEIHRLRLYRADDLVQELQQCGFRARKLARYGRFRFPPGIAGVLAIKP